MSQSDDAARPTGLEGRRVVVCRAADQAIGLVAAVEALGATAIALPLLEQQAPADGGAALNRALNDDAAFDWMVLTSANAVRAVAGLHPVLPPGLQIAVVGPATARAVAAVGWTVDFEPSVATAAALAAELPLGSPSLRVLAPLAELAADTLERTLTDRGAIVERVEAYRMAMPRHSNERLAEALSGDVVLLTSPSTAERFAALAGEQRSNAELPVDLPAAVAIGPSTEAAAQAAGFTVLATADPHTEDGLVAALVRSIEG
ncbi:MAG: uroporphyrinogen-III synthase [Acidimicrobiales bacterium]